MSNPESSHQLRTTVHWYEQPNDPLYLQLYPSYRYKIKLSLTLAINRSDLGRVVIIYPGNKEKIDGPHKRYKDLACQIVGENLGSVVRCSNPARKLFLPSTNLRKMINYTLDHSQYICGSEDPELLLMGFSAGASAIAAVASDYKQVSRILLVAPSGDMPKETVQRSLQQFMGEVYIVVGDKDEVVQPRAGQIYYDLATTASNRELFYIPNTDHYFNGEVNDMIFKKAPFYAFAQGEKPKFP